MKKLLGLITAILVIALLASSCDPGVSTSLNEVPDWLKGATIDVTGAELTKIVFSKDGSSVSFTYADGSTYNYIEVCRKMGCTYGGSGIMADGAWEIHAEKDGSPYSILVFSHGESIAVEEKLGRTPNFMTLTATS